MFGPARAVTASLGDEAALLASGGHRLLVTSAGGLPW